MKESMIKQKGIWLVSAGESLLIVGVSILPSACLAFSTYVGSAGEESLAALFMTAFTSTERIVLSASFLGTALINVLDIGGDRKEAWVSLRKAEYAFVMLAYLAVMVCYCKIDRLHPLSTLPFARAATILITVSGLILWLSSLWRRKNDLDHALLKNPYQDANERFSEGFGMYLKK